MTLGGRGGNHKGDGGGTGGGGGEPRTSQTLAELCTHTIWREILADQNCHGLATGKDFMKHFLLWFDDH